ncbi:MAG: FAD binding domain-containing protein [Betaproteobacteria bacterium]|jgi:2-polyprenyl-6-methoxyphenol hydroxylase-like FAD-dependent oxidoreductase|nr:FAD binding domain-containing protein [Betaproteobacteria bacterium]
MARVPRALVIGGSLGGLFAANLLLRQGWDVEVFEQSAQPLAGRGAGIITHPDLFAALGRIGVSAAGGIGVDIAGRVAFDRDGRVLGRMDIPQCLTTWGCLHTLLLAAFPGGRYHLGHALTAVEQDAAGVTAVFANGQRARGDLLVAADGIRSAVRAQLAPAAQPRYAGYIAWRGLVEETALTETTRHDLFPRFAFSLAPAEHMLGYPVAGFDNSVRDGERCFNFVWYRPVHAGDELPELCTDIHGRRHEMAIPPPLIRPQVIAAMREAARALLSPQFAEVVEKTRQPFFQAIFDLESETLQFGRVALLGDAAFVARPHVGMGVSKAAGDALCLAAELAHEPKDPGAALTRYSAQRLGFGRAVIAHARALGAYLETCAQGREDSTLRERLHTPHAVMRDIAVTREF